MEQSVEWRPPFYLVFVDFEEVFDTLTHTVIWNALVCKGASTKILNLMKTMYNNATCRILHEKQLGKSIKIETGDRQGCMLSPLLFNCVLDVVIQKSTSFRRGITCGLHYRLDDLR